jgi:hypothetical protein
MNAERIDQWNSDTLPIYEVSRSVNKFFAAVKLILVRVDQSIISAFVGGISRTNVSAIHTDCTPR